MYTWPPCTPMIVHTTRPDKHEDIISDVSTKYFMQIWSGAQAVMKLRPDFIDPRPCITGQWSPCILKVDFDVLDFELYFKFSDNAGILRRKAIRKLHILAFSKIAECCIGYFCTSYGDLIIFISCLQVPINAMISSNLKCHDGHRDADPNSRTRHDSSLCTHY